tara:strand:+ start:2138 stop:2281 length:144 start_codon:yes stop_codon:yes gene_type:complete
MNRYEMIGYIDGKSGLAARMKNNKDYTTGHRRGLLEFVRRNPITGWG